MYCPDYMVKIWIETLPNPLFPLIMNREVVLGFLPECSSFVDVFNMSRMFHGLIVFGGTFIMILLLVLVLMKKRSNLSQQTMNMQVG